MMSKTRFSFFQSLIALLLCFSMLLGTTFAWFTESVSSDTNIIKSGNIDLEMYWTDDPVNGIWHDVEDPNYNTIFDYNNWEPGYSEVKYIKIVNSGDLALNYKFTLMPEGEVGKLAEVIAVRFAKSGTKIETREQFDSLSFIGFLKNVMNGGATASGTILPAGAQGNPDSTTPVGEVILTLGMQMIPTAGNEYQNQTIGTGFSITAIASQSAFEEDSYGKDYDLGETFDELIRPAMGSVTVVPEDGKVPAGGATIDAVTATAKIPGGVALNDNTDTITLTVTPLESTTTDITVVNNEILIPVDIHAEGISDSNTVPIIVDLGPVMPKYLNIGNYSLIHVEDGVNNTMTAVSNVSELTSHNTFVYDTLTGNITVALATFSEVALIADTENAWEGEFDYTWYDANKTELTIANADQLAAFGAIVGGMNGQTQDSFKDKTVKLISDINLGDKESENNPNLIFYPIGYYNDTGSYKKTSGGSVTSSVSSFEGTFDGNGHTIANFYQNTWEMFGDYNDGYSGTPNHYKDAMGLFGYVLNGTVKNLTVDNFSSDGEFTPTGVIAAYADGNSTFENIALTDCNPRVYNTGNGGIIGIAGDTSTANDDHITLKNITVDNSNKISALWGSWDVACGGLVGMYRGNVDGNGNATGDTISFTNCHVSAQIDVYNDVCANYQYYAYRYAGMIIGSVRHNTKNAEGKVIPDMKGISATGCTVNYGDWNDYYYCEFEKNTMASYSEDYQFSRVPHSELNFTDTNGNGVVDADERASVTGCKHSHTDAENHQAIYLPFHQLFTGYSWGVSSIGLEELEGIENITVTIGKEESVVKFASTVTELANNKEYKLSDIFTFVDKGVEIIPNTLTVTVTNVNKDNPDPVSATFVRDDNTWKNSTLKLTGTGNATITIQDYYFCTPTTITVNVTERQPAEKFEVAFDHNPDENGKQNHVEEYLYRVGNQNAVSVGSLFTAKEGATVDNASVTVENISGNASGTYSNNAIQFSDTGVVKVTITDNDYCIPAELILEVVDATNLTKATGTTTGGNFVLLNDVNTSTYVNYWNSNVYGNGFTYSLKGAPTAYNSKQGKGIIITKNTTLDNLKIVGDVYTGYGAFTNNDYYNTAIDVTGDTTIQNCYISGCAAPVRARNNVTLKNTTLYGGTVGNLIIEAGLVTLEDVTTANYDDGRTLVGMGIVIHSDATESAKLVLNGTLTQYNFINESNVPSDTYAKNLHDAMFSNNCSQYQFGTSPNRYVNTGIISLTSTFNSEDITDNAETGYVGKSLKVSSYDGYVYTQLNTSGSVNNNFSEYKPDTQGAVPPSYSFDFTNKNYAAKTDGSNDYCYEENGKVNISMDEGDTFNWDTSILTIGKGITSYTVSMNGTDYTGKSIAFNTAGDYTVTYTYTDNNNTKLDENGNITTYSVTYTKTVNITVAVVKATTKHAEFTFGSSNTASTTVTVGNSTYVMPNVSGTSSTIGSTTVEGNTIYYPIVEIIMSDGKTSHTSGWYAYFPVFSGVVTITDYADNGTGDKMTPYNGSTTTMPSGLSIVGDPTQLFKYQSSSAAGSAPVVKSNKLVYSSASISANRNEYNTVVQYSYTDNAGATYYYYVGYHAPAQSYSNTCVTPDTLITLADGSQKRVDSLTGEEALLVWNLETGKLDTAPVAYIVDHNGVVENREIIHLNFANGKTVKVIGEHVFYDATLNKYINVNNDNADALIGHNFAALNFDGTSVETVKLESVYREYAETETFEIVSYKHLTCFTEDILSTSAFLDPLLNIFDINTDTMAYDIESVLKDIDTYGLYTYADFDGIISEEAFELYNAQYLKIAVGKGYITWDDILGLIDIYFDVDVQPIA